MNYKTHNQKQVNVNGTFLQGEIITTYDKLVEAFGEPTSADEYKIDAEWDIEFYPKNEKEPVVATIYNWKNGHNYLGAEGWDVDAITYWHIGGYNPIVKEYVKNVLDNIHINNLMDNENIDNNLHDLVIFRNNNETEQFHLFKGDNRTIKAVDVINQILTDNELENLTYDYDEFGDNELEISQFISNYEKALKNTPLSIEWYSDIEAK